ncbi:MAG: hypothetical protein ILNGONEN_00689 [Syntrophorhabdaceae bacterium]|nr:hypothetical protein [Syntrophorhabdaceae bacterium]
MTDFEYSGLWWLPSEESNQIAGNLTFSNHNGFQLKLIGAFDEVFDGTSKTIGSEDFSKSYPLILGITHTGKKVTLQDCRATGRQITMPGFESPTYSPHLAYFGIHASDLNALQFHKIDVGFNFLNDWVAESGFKVIITHNQNSEPEKYQLEYSFLDEIKVTAATCTFSIQRTLNTKGSILRGISTEEVQSIGIESLEPLSIEEWNAKYVAHLQNLLTLATFRSNSLIDVYAYKKNHTINLRNGRTQEIPVQIVFHTFEHESGPIKDLLPHEMLFSLKDVELNLGEILGNWFRMCITLKGVFDLFFILQHSPEMYLQNQFLNIVLAMEGYHRGAIDKNGKKLFENRELRSKKLIHNKVSLKTRILDLLKYIDQIVSKLVPDKELFAKRVARYRNQLAHQLTDQEPEISSSSELFWITQAMMYILRACFLKDIGIPESTCSQLFSRNQKYLFAVHQINSFFESK